LHLEYNTLLKHVTFCFRNRDSNDRSSTKREGYLEWSDYFMAIAFLSAQRSKDPRTQVAIHLYNNMRVIIINIMLDYPYSKYCIHNLFTNETFFNVQSTRITSTTFKSIFYYLDKICKVLNLSLL